MLSLGWWFHVATSLTVAFWSSVSVGMNILVQVLLLATLLFSVIYRLGWWHRLVWHGLEHVARHALNGTPVTIGSFAMDWMRGTLLLNNVVVHAPHRPRFAWASPVLVRVGRIRLEFNPIHCLFGLVVLGDPVPVLDVHLLHVSDIQCFLERSGHVFNVYLLDPFYELPPPQEQAASSDTNHKDASGTTTTRTTDSLVYMEPDAPLSTSSIRMIGVDNPNNNNNNKSGEWMDPEDEEEAAAAAAWALDSSVEPLNEGTPEEEDETAAQNDRAELVVGEMLKAVHDLGRAVQEGQLPQALQEQRQRIARGLKEFHVDKRAMTEGLSLVGKVGQMVAEKSQQAVAQSNLILQGPKRRPPPPNTQQQLILARFGRVILDDLRVFTRTTVVVEVAQEEEEEDDEEENEQEDALAAGTASKPEQGGELTSNGNKLLLPPPKKDGSVEGPGTTTTDPNTSSSSSLPLMVSNNNDANNNSSKKKTKKTGKKMIKQKQSFWNKPIKLERVAVRASEFGAPLSAKDEQGFPVLFQPLEKSTDAILKRVVGDIAKCNTGRLVRTAMGEVLDFYMEREYSSSKDTSGKAEETLDATVSTTTKRKQEKR